MQIQKITAVVTLAALLLGFQVGANASPAISQSVDPLLGVPSQKIQNQFLTEANYLLFKNSNSKTFSQNVKAAKFEFDSFPIIGSPQKDLSEPEKQSVWIGNGNDYRNYRFFPVKNRIKDMPKDYSTYLAMKWIKDNPGTGLDAENMGWCAWFVRFMIRDTKIQGNNFVTYFGNSALRSGGKNVWGRGTKGFWYLGKQQKDVSKVPEYIPQPGDLILYYRNGDEATISEVLSSKTHPDGKRPFDHMGFIPAVVEGVPYIMEGNRGGPNCTIDTRSPYLCKDRRKGWGYMRLNKGLPKQASVTSYTGWVIIRPNWKN